MDRGFLPLISARLQENLGAVHHSMNAVRNHGQKSCQKMQCTNEVNAIDKDAIQEVSKTSQFICNFLSDRYFIHQFFTFLSGS